MSNYRETTEALARLFNLPKMTQRAVIVLRADGPPLIRVTRLMIEGNDVRQITERFELRKVGAGRAAIEGHNDHAQGEAQGSSRLSHGATG